MSAPQTPSKGVQHLPSIIALQCFECAAESLSFTQAGEDLNLTQSAVSRQIKSLEQSLGVELFARVKQRLTLTPAGASYAREVKAVLAQLRRAGAALAAHTHQTRLRVGAESALLTRYLMPILGEFNTMHPEVDIEMVTNLKLLYEQQSGFEVGVLFGNGNWDGFDAHLLMNETLVAVCSEKVLERYSIASQRDDLRSYPFLHQRSSLSASELWWHSAGLEAAAIEAMPGQRFENFPMLRDAAVQGLGVAILPQYFVAEDLLEGSLVVACEEDLLCEQAYYVVLPHAQHSETASLFSQWLLARKTSPSMKKNSKE
jgi:DNA-binding transcriptional LysR family regulator